MPDDSHLDDQYFVDRYKYNCPFCNRRHVSYHVSGNYKFNWTDTKTCFAYLVACGSCKNISLHLSFENIKLHSLTRGCRFASGIEDLDDRFFYSVPSSFFILDSRIPRVLRELFAESEGCLKSNFLTGASACARKIVYELAILENAKGKDYDERIKSLKATKPDIDSAYFDTLLTIQQVTSSKVHENAYDGWASNHLRLILATLNEILHEIYVLPKLKQEKRSAIIEMKEEVLGKKKPKGTASPEINEDTERGGVN